MPLITYEMPNWLTKWVESGSDPADLPTKSRNKLAKINISNEILDEYETQGYQLTLRQLFYQLVSRDIIPNKQSEYKALGSAVSDGRMWGLIDWDRLVDRGRDFIRRSHWTDPSDIISSAAHGYGIDCWTKSQTRIEVWVEKQALEDVIARPAQRFDCGYIACKGYMSQSEMWAAAQRIITFEKKGQQVIILHLGDHDPSGIDMTRDIQERLWKFDSNVHVERIALTMEQIEDQQPPPNPAKTTDTRYESYLNEFGEESWELDALEPAFIDQLITNHIEEHIDESYHNRRTEENDGKHCLLEVARRWDEVTSFMEDNPEYDADDDENEDEDEE